MPFLVDEQPTSIAKLGSTPIVSTHREFQQDRSAVFQLCLADMIQLNVSMVRKTKYL
jgi:hypothetical protein